MSKPKTSPGTLRGRSAREKALRNLALRTRRRQLIEENAAKIATKVLFTPILGIFPALLLGPAVLQSMQAIIPVAGGAGGS